VIGQLPQLARFHVPRESFNRMEAQILNTSQSERITFVVYGMPGSGKTQMGAYFIEKYKSQ
jgi:polynucleotide 5'-kinase involved in rRNA processing